jgi:hypothetical protein
LIVLDPRLGEQVGEANLPIYGKHERRSTSNTFSRNTHRYHAKAYFALKPIDNNDSATQDPQILKFKFP